ncbi:Uncharacterised protein [Capnocytophaga ochracea]|uniref:Uncharacterized protein n=1 Tax=Capnocytophaga ochracea TaxID=1018 RepID=A0A7Z8YBN8_CAPOC|nr:Uncharacterised protein [Capnocytophaga ochracea]
MPIMPVMPIMPIIPEIPVINFAKGASRTGKNFGKVCAVKSDTLEDSEDIGGIRKRVERDFGEKRV